MNPAEDLLAIHLAELGLRFVRQWRYAKGRRFRADFAVWRTIFIPDEPPESSYIEQRFALIEVTGGVYTRQAHGSITGVLIDNTRLYFAFLADWPMLRFTPQQVENGTAKALIEAALGRKA